ncbi:MAG TPA: trehalase family glycosidase [Victivallales bacterium]|nr:trehalase family glycosidase [Victivallales bacterium]
MLKKFLFAVFMSSVVIFSSCRTESIQLEKAVETDPLQDTEIVITDLGYPEVDKNAQFTGRYAANTVIKYSELNDKNDSSKALRSLFRKYWADEDNKGKTSLSITQDQFEKDCLVPYINGLWISSETGLLRLVNRDYIFKLAKDHMIKLSPKTSTYSYNMQKLNGWPVYYPPQFKKLVEDKIGDVKGTVLLPLPEQKPEPKSLVLKNGKWENQEVLYNHIGLLYLPNNYIVPGGLFNEMFGWDSYFMILGLLNSSKYILNNPESEIYMAEKGYYKATALDAFRMFKIAKGMVDNHIFEINFYGGYILNANRLYTMERSQPPFLTIEAFDVFNFWDKYGEKLKKKIVSLSLNGKVQFANDELKELDYFDTLSPYLKSDNHSTNYNPPANYQEWMAREVLPAAIAYFNYYAKPSVVYGNWSPYDKYDETNDYIYQDIDKNINKNKRVVTVKANGKKYNISRYYTEGEGPCPEVVFSADKVNRSLYDKVFCDYFKKHPETNPENIFYDTKSGKLTGWFYKNDRAVRASGFDLSERYGFAGQECLDFCSVALNSLLYKMADDISHIAKYEKTNEILSDTNNSFGMDNDKMDEEIEYVRKWRASIKDYINSELWDKNTKGYADKRITKRNDKNTEFTYPYVTKYCPFDFGIAQKDYSPKCQKYPFIPSQKSINEFNKIFKRDDIKKLYGVTTSLHNTNGATQWDFPVAWAPNEYFAVKALENREISNETISQGWRDTIDIYFVKYGIIIEKYLAYNPLGEVKVTTGYAANNAGFGWTNGMYMYFFNNRVTVGSKFGGFQLDSSRASVLKKMKENNIPILKKIDDKKTNTLTYFFKGNHFFEDADSSALIFYKNKLCYYQVIFKTQSDKINALYSSLEELLSSKFGKPEQKKSGPYYESIFNYGDNHRIVLLMDYKKRTYINLKAVDTLIFKKILNASSE